jgi:large subunit ribosomal protein L15
MDLTEVSTGVQKRKLKKRVGRGIGSGHGKTGSRGHKGQYASAGANMPGALFTGGQTPIHRRFPKRGFSNATFAKVYAIVNVGDLNKLDDGTAVTMEVLNEKRIVMGTYDGLRVLGEGELTKKLTVTADHFTASAKTKIEAKGGTTVLIPGPKKPVRNKMGTRAKALAAKGPKPTATK